MKLDSTSIKESGKGTRAVLHVSSRFGRAIEVDLLHDLLRAWQAMTQNRDNEILARKKIEALIEDLNAEVTIKGVKMNAERK
jgi:hypothetical protein